MEEAEKALKTLMVVAKETVRRIRDYGQELRNDWSEFDGREGRRRLDGETEPLALMIGELEKNLNWIAPDISDVSGEGRKAP